MIGVMIAVTVFADFDEDHVTAGFVGADGAADAGAAAGADEGVGAGSGAGAAGVTLTALEAAPLPMPLIARSLIW